MVCRLHAIFFYHFADFIQGVEEIENEGNQGMLISISMGIDSGGDFVVLPEQIIFHN